ncbi:MAG: V-type ATP synthase subunit D [Gammaproteobacteria bacterium]
MPEAFGERSPTRAALLELQAERRMVREGYDFLDEKRLLLAAEILRLLGDYERLAREFEDCHQEAARAFADATARHGLQGIEVYPAAALERAELSRRSYSFLGVALQDTELVNARESTPVRPGAHPSPEARRSRERFHELITRAAVLAGLTGNLQRLLDEYRRTERRARALENVLMPEIDKAITEIDNRLEEIDLEEAVRVRFPQHRSEG